MPGTKKILYYFLNQFDEHTGGVERISAVIGHYLNSKGNTIYYLSDNCDSATNCLNNIFLPKAGGLTNKENRNFLANFIEEENIDIIINQAGIFPSSHYLIKIKGKARLISVMHNTLWGMYSYPNLNVRNVQLNRFIYSTPIKALFRILFYIKYHWYFKRIVNGSDKVCLLSDYFRTELDFYSGQKCSNLCAIPNCITMSSSDKLPKKENSVLFVGRLEWQKRPDLLLDIWKIVVRKYPNWDLYILGDGVMKEYLVDKVTHDKIKNVHIEGKKNPMSYYMKSKVLCMTSCYEGFGLVLLEAMNFGVVPIAFDVFPNLHDIIDNNVDGFCIKYPNIKDYAERIIEIMQNPSLQRNFQNMMPRKIEKYSIDNIGSKWLNLIQEV